MRSSLSNKLNRFICVLLAVVMTAGFIPAPASADAKYDAYLRELEEYNTKKAAYDSYISELAYYNAHNAEWEEYDAQLVKYNKYLKYLSDLAAYNEAVENYHNNLDAYTAYTKYVSDLKSCEGVLTVIEAVVNGDMYETLMSETVEAVLESEDVIAGYTTVSKQAVRDAGSATHTLLSILNNYISKNSLGKKLEYYKSSYSSLKSNFGTLYTCLNTLYGDNAVKAKLKMEGKDYRYCEFLCQLYTISLCLDDSKTINKKWKITSAGGMLSLETLGGYAGLEDTNSASPESLELPVEVPYAEYPVAPVMPDQVAEVLEPIAPSGRRPVLPSPVAYPGDPPSKPTYTVTWKNYDGTVLKTDTVTYGETPSYGGQTPTKPEDAQYTYTFSGNWSPTVAAVSGDTTYTAQFKTQLKSYAVTWKNHDGTVLRTDTVAYGETPSYKGTTPTKAATAQYDYSFAGWTPAVTSVSGNATYTAKFTESTKSYTVTWKNYDGTVLRTDTFAYGATPSYGGQTPTKPEDAQYKYSFSGWTPAVTAVSGNATYTAKFSESTKSYTVTWKNYDGSTLKTDTVEYGKMPSYSGETPTRAATAQYTYKFKEWSPALSTVKADITYTAQFSETVNQYTVTWKNGDTILKTETLAYGATPAYTGTEPTKAATAQYTYTFSGWSPAISTVKADSTYTAQFSETVNKYTVTWKNYDGSILKTDTVEYGKTPSYSGTPTRAKTDQYTYTFSKWSPTVVKVTGDATYTAQYTQTTNQYTVTWKNYDGSILKTDTVEYGKMPSYSGTEPTKPATAQYTYTFKGWTPEVSAVTGNVTYTAKFDSTVNKYTITWKNYDGTTLETDTGVEYGATPTYNGATPTRPSTAQYTYTFKGWTPEVSAVTGNVTYTAKFDSTVNKYTVTWKNYDGKVLKTDNLAYGATPSYTGIPTKPATAQYTYTFSGWSPTISYVTGNVTYTAKFDSTVNKYTVTWKNYDGTTLETDTGVEYGATPTHNGATPTRPSTAQYTYTFKGWTPEVSAVTGNVTYTAKFDSTVNKYTVAWKNYDGTTLKTDTGVEYGATPAYNGATPTKPATAQYTYTFKGWTPEVSAVTGNVTYTAKFDSTVNKYTVTWKNYDGTTLETDTGVEYGATPTYNGATPTRPSTAQYTYTFKGWTPEVSAVTGNVTYTAKFDSTVNKYTVTWKNYDGKVLKTDTLAYGATPSYTGTPTKPATAQYTYAFLGWSPAISTVKADATYTAQFSETVNKYTVTWKNYDGKLLKTDTLAYGVTPSYTGTTPTKTATAQYTYSFDGWSPTISSVKENITYTAQFKETVNNYTVTWRNHDGSTLKTESVAYGVTPSYGGTPTRAKTDQYTYTFSGWSPTVVKVTGDVTYKAQYTEAVNKYTVTWKNYDGSTLKTESVAYGVTPSYGGTPTRAKTDQYTYTFSGWSPTITTVKSDAIYTAQFSETVNKYTVTWKNYDGKVLKTDSLPYGSTPAYTGTTPTKPATSQNSYMFDFWSPTISEVTGNVTYTANFTASTNKYTVTWNNYDGTLLEKDVEVSYGQMPSYNGSTPQKPGDGQYSYTFSGWSPSVTSVKGNITYTAKFTESTKSYTVTWKNYDGKLLTTDTLAYGATPSYTGTPTKPSTAQYSYTFSGWSPAISTVKENVVYTAQFSETLNKYTVTWKNFDGTILKTETLAYGATPTYAGTPAREATSQYGYTFSGWSPTISTVKADVTYTAQFTESVNKYTIIWKNHDGKVLKTDTLTYGSTPAYTGTTPTKASTAQYNYTFAGWSPTISTVKESVTYTAQFSETVNKYTVTWKNFDGTILKTETLAYGATPTYSGTPVREATAQYTYAFSGWSPTISTVKESVTYTAQFSETVNKYTVTWKNFDGTILKTDMLAYGATPTYAGTPAREATSQYGYTFSGWSPTISTVKADVTYTAQFTESVNKYTVTWKNHDGKLLKTDTLAYGATPSYIGTPTKASTAQYIYTFSGWSPTISAVKADVTYTAQFSETINKYTVTWKNYDGKVIKTDTVAYGETPFYSGTEPIKPATAQYGYTFSGWSPTISTVKENVTYTAQFSEAVNKYTVTWKNYDGTILKTDTLAYGATPTYSGTPVREATAQYTYAFSGWSPAVTAVKADEVYTAQFNETVNKYTVTWKNHDGSVLKTETLAYGVTPAYKGTTPTKSVTDQYTYTFSGWLPAVATVGADATYTAQFSETVNKYTVTWKNYDGKVLKADTLEYGATPSYNGSTPQRSGDAQYSYTFSGWAPAVAEVVGNATYTADFERSENSYTVTWKNYDGNTLKTETLVYGATPFYDGTPERAATAQYTYVFDGWTPAVSAVSANVTYTAKYADVINEYTVTWQNYDGTVLKTERFSYGETPVYGDTPLKPATAQYGYTFSGWSPSITAVKADATYTAQFSEVTNKYEVVWQNYDGSELSTQTLEYGVLPVYPGGVPQKTGDEQYSYTFSGWSPAVTKVVGNAVYAATFERSENVYTVTWKNYDGNTLKTDSVTYGNHPEYAGDAPVKPSDAKYSYIFSGWSPEVTVVTGNVVYTAEFSEKLNEYTVAWKNYDGTVLKTDQLPYGTLPSYDGQPPQRPSTVKHEYSFSGWTPKITEISENVAYTAVFDESLKEYTVVWKDGEEILQTDRLGYGEMPVYRGSTDKAATKEKTFEFLGWSPNVVHVTEDAIYTASYRETTIYYSVIWQIGDTVLSEQLYEYMQSPKVPSDPDQYLENEEKTFAKFIGWDKEVGPVTDNIVYRAKFRADIFDLPTSEKANVSLIPSASVYTVATEKEDLEIGLSELAKTAVGNGKDLLIEYKNGVQVYFPNKLAAEIIERKLHVSLRLGNTNQTVRLLSTNDSSDGEEIFGGRVILTDGEGNIVTMTGWQLRVPVENGNMSGLSGYSLDDGEKSYKLAQSGNYAVFVSDGDAEFKLVRKLSVRVDANGGGNISFVDSEFKAGDTVKADVRAAIGYEVESIELYYEADGEKIPVDFDADTMTFVMPPYNVVFSVKFAKLVFVVNFYVENTLYHTATYGYGDDLILPEDPSKPDDGEFVYTFSGWTPGVSEKVFASADYTAKFNASTVADENYGKGEYGFNFPYKLFIIAVVFFGAVGTGIFLIVHFVRKKKKKK